MTTQLKMKLINRIVHVVYWVGIMYMNVRYGGSYVMVVNAQVCHSKDES